MKPSFGAALIVLALAGIASCRARRTRHTSSVPSCKRSVKWASGYPKKTERNKVDCVDCSASNEFTLSVTWERTVTLQTKIGLSLPDVLGANVAVSRTVTNTKGVSGVV